MPASRPGLAGVAPAASALTANALAVTAPLGPGVLAGFTTRAAPGTLGTPGGPPGPSAAVLDRLRRDSGLVAVAAAQQVHGTTVVTVGDPGAAGAGRPAAGAAGEPARDPARGPARELAGGPVGGPAGGPAGSPATVLLVGPADALVTTAPGVGLVVLGADCAPVLLADPVAGVVAAAHCGRQGLQRDVLGAVVAAALAAGASRDRLQVVVGPTICPACYPLPAAVVAGVAEQVPAAAGRAADGQPAVDLRAGIDATLRAHGVTAVRHVGGCTAEGVEEWFSHRARADTGRHGGLVALGPPARR